MKNSHLIPHLLISLAGISFTLFGIIKDNAPPVILDDDRIALLKGYDDLDCSYGRFHDAHKSTCLTGLNTEYPSVQSVKEFYASQMENLEWVKIPHSLHEDPITDKNTEFFLKDVSSHCKLERAITTVQNTYRGGVKLEDISIDFEEYLVECVNHNLSPF